MKNYDYKSQGKGYALSADETVAEKLGVSCQAISKWETGQSEPTASNFVGLANVFEIGLSEELRLVIATAEVGETGEKVPAFEDTDEATKQALQGILAKTRPNRDQ